MSRRLLALLIAATYPTFASAQDATLASAADCIANLGQFNEDRPWARIAIDRERVVALVESARNDKIYVEVGCNPDGNMFEGQRYTIPTRMQPTSIDDGVPRGEYDADALEDAVAAAKRAGGGGEWERVVITALPGTRGSPVTTVEFLEGRTIYLNASLAATEETPPADWEFKEAGPAAPTGSTFGGESVMADPLKLLSYLEGSLGREPVQRLVLQQGMAMVAYGQASALKTRHWTLHDGQLNAGEPEAADASAGQRCNRTPTVGEARASLTKIMSNPKVATNVKRGVMLLLECDGAGKPMKWQLLGGDGKLEEGVALKQEYFPL